jgi:hypothetical protein
MKKISTLLAILLISSGATAEERKDVMSNLTLAAAETGTSPIWTRANPQPKNDKNLTRALEANALELQNNINAKLEKALEEKLKQEFQF